MTNGELLGEQWDMENDRNVKIAQIFIRDPTYKMLVKHLD